MCVLNRPAVNVRVFHVIFVPVVFDNVLGFQTIVVLFIRRLVAVVNSLVRVDLVGCEQSHIIEVPRVRNERGNDSTGAMNVVSGSRISSLDIELSRTGCY